MLSDLVYKIPELLDYLSKTALQNILATSSALRQHVHQHVTKVKMHKQEEDMAVLIKGQWPRLVHVSVYAVSRSQVDTGIAALLAQATQLHHQLQSLDFSYTRMTSAAVAVLPTASFRQLSSLQLRSCSLDQACAPALSKSQLPSLQALDLTDNILDANAMAHLCNANWPNLRKLRLARNRLGNAGICHLATANWPLLEKLHLEATAMGGDALVQLCQARWPCLQRLGLSRNPLHQIPKIHVDPAWASLKEVRLAYCGMDNALEQLPRLCLHEIEVVDLLGNFVNSVGVQLLVQADWPKLVAIRLNGHDLGEVGVQKFTQGNWPQLERLNLSGIRLSPKVISLLSQGSWPKLRKLDICGGSSKLSGFEHIQPLLQAEWPLLEWLCLHNVFDSTHDSAWCHHHETMNMLHSRWPSLTLHVAMAWHDFAC